MNKLFPCTLLCCLLAAACAQQNATQSTGETARQYLDLWMSTMYPGVEMNDDGIYIVEDTPGTGEEWSSDKSYVYIDYLVTELDGTMYAYTDVRKAQQLGTYKYGNYYGPRFTQLGKDNSSAGLDALLKGMRKGGTRKAVIPSWMTTTSRYNTQAEYIKACNTIAHRRYTVTLLGMSNDMEQTEIDSLGNFMAHNYPDALPRESKNFTYGALYFISDTTAFTEDTRRAADAEVSINYTGMLLNGQVFDTTIEKVAKEAGIYQEGKTYSSQTVKFDEDADKITLGGSSVIRGFRYGLDMMHWKGQSATFLFISSLGYESTGSGNTIPPYSPLLFEVEILP